MSIGTKKYRPYFTAPEMKEIITALKEKPSPYRLGIIQYLETFQLKMNHGLVQPAHVTEGTKIQKLEANLGMTATKPVEDPDEPSAPALHKIWMDHPEKLTPPQIDRVMSYRFQEGMMTPEEEKKYITQLY